MIFFAAKNQGASNASASLASLLVGIVGMVVGSHLGQPEDSVRLNRIFGYLDRPALDGGTRMEAEIE